jgi:hypothetical protein
MTPPVELLQWVDRITTVYGGESTIVCESYTINALTARITQSPWSLEIIGGLKYLSYENCGRDLILQHPGDAKSFSTNAKLRELELYQVGTAGHGNDAMRHLLLFLVRSRTLPEEYLLRLAR